MLQAQNLLEIMIGVLAELIPLHFSTDAGNEWYRSQGFRPRDWGWYHNMSSSPHRPAQRWDVLVDRGRGGTQGHTRPEAWCRVGGGGRGRAVPTSPRELLLLSSLTCAPFRDVTAFGTAPSAQLPAAEERPKRPGLDGTGLGQCIRPRIPDFILYITVRKTLEIGCYPQYK